MEFNRERIEENTLRLGTASGEIQSALEKKLSAEQESQEIELSLQSARQELENARQLRQQRAEALQTLEASLSARQSALRTLQNQLLGISQKLSRLPLAINTGISERGNRVPWKNPQSKSSESDKHQSWDIRKFRISTGGLARQGNRRKKNGAAQKCNPN
jgi:chromosome segregation ATPase